jgi:hypothetical protein
MVLLIESPFPSNKQQFLGNLGLVPDFLRVYLKGIHVLLFFFKRELSKGPMAAEG